MLEDLGLDRTAEVVYRLMLTHREWGASRIATELGCPESEVREVLNRLADLALLRLSPNGANQWRTVSPDVGLPRLLRRRQADLLEKQRRFVESQLAVSQLISDCAETEGPVPGDAERIEGIDAVESRLEELAHRAESDCLSFMPGGGQSSNSLLASGPLDELMLLRRRIVLTVYLDSVRNSPTTLKYADWLVGLGGGVRTTPSLPLRMVVFDRKVALVPIDPDNSRRGAVQVSAPGVIAALVALFQQVWTAATPLGEASASSTDGELTPQEQALLNMLAQGLTDEVTARRLGISLRTERRMVARIMERLGARSRFEAGFRAGEGHWLSS